MDVAQLMAWHVVRLTEDPKHIHPSSIQTRPRPPMIDCVDKARKRSDRVTNSLFRVRVLPCE
eukprot:scaffold317268_cov35-Attheya_sp.AAC.2